MKYEMGNENEIGLYIDEFQAVSPLKIKSILEKVRSSKFLTNLSIQSLEQIIVSSPENGQAVFNSIKDTINNFIVLYGSTEETAQIFSGIIGKIPKKTVQINYNKKPSLFENYFGLKKNDYRYTESIEEDYIIAPYEFQSLSRPIPENGYESVGFYITKASSDKTFKKVTRTVAQKLQFILCDEVLAPIPKSFTQAFEENTKLKSNNYNRENILNLVKEQVDEEVILIEEKKNNIPKLKTISLPPVDLDKQESSNKEKKINNVNHLPRRRKLNTSTSNSEIKKINRKDELNNIFS